MVDLMGDQPGNAPLEDGDLRLPVDVLVLDVDDEWPRHHAPHIEETQAAFVLLMVSADSHGPGLGRVMVSAPGGGTIAAARSMPIWAAAIPRPLPKV